MAERKAAKPKPRAAKDARDPATGKFLPGNRFWKARSTAGPKPKFKKADDLWKACCEYFEWVDANPLHEAKAFAHQGAVTVQAMPKMRAMTIQGMCLFLDVTFQTWSEWRKSRPDLSEVITRAEEVIYAQKFAGAAADLLNANIIARDLGLADRREHSGPEGGPIKSEVSARGILADRIARVSARSGQGGRSGGSDGGAG